MDLNRNDSPNNNNNNNDGRKPGGNRPKGSIGTALLITLAIVLLVNWIYGSISKSQYTQTSFSDFLAAKDAGQLSEVEIQSDRIIYMTKEEAGKPAAMQKACYTGLPGGGDLSPMLYGQTDIACRGLDPAQDALEMDLLYPWYISCQHRPCREPR